MEVRHRIDDFGGEDSLLFTEFDLETNDVPVLNLTLSKGHFRFHKLNHPRFDFLELDAQSHVHDVCGE
jgi:hypothetical protein